MLGITDLTTYIIGAIAIILLPGPNSMFCLTVGAQFGVKKGYQAITGVFLGDSILMLLTALGAGSVMSRYPAIFYAVKYVGAVYLIYLGSRMLLDAGRRFYTPLVTASKVRLHSPKVFVRSLSLSLLNPKAILFFLSFFVQFVDPGYPYPAISFLVLAIILQIISVLYLLVLVFSGTYFVSWFRQRRRLSAAGMGLIGTLFIGFAVNLLLTSAASY
ncbi:leucine efflux protein LeuE [Chromatiaceae bacterium AAb-1]|nr:leucine efflux protein LeuE [Chromatiaceae bacterium AAb-1]